MNIPTDLALKIVKDMKDIINQDLNFINTNGYIIASTDKTRIGQIHEASLKCIATNSDVVINNDDEYAGTKKGINIPVHLNNEIAGVIGITGEREDVEKFGKIIKSMTEILIKEAWLKELFIKRKEQNRNMIETILFGNHRNIEFYTLLKFPYTVIIGNTDNRFENSNDLYNILENFLSRNKKNIFTITSDQIILFINSNKMPYIKEFISSIQNHLQETLKFDFRFGIGRSVESLDDFSLSYSEAKNALKYILNFDTEKKQIFYSELDLGILLPNISRNKMEEFVNKILGNLSEDEIEDFYEIFHAYKMNNGSIKEASAALFMHKNTLQYQLNKIEKITGYNPRDLKDFSLLDFAFMLKKFDYYNKKGEQL